MWFVALMRRVIWMGKFVEICLLIIILSWDKDIPFRVRQQKIEQMSQLDDPIPKHALLSSVCHPTMKWEFFLFSSNFRGRKKLKLYIYSINNKNWIKGIDEKKCRIIVRRYKSKSKSKKSFEIQHTCKSTQTPTLFFLIKKIKINFFKYIIIRIKEDWSVGYYIRKAWHESVWGSSKPPTLENLSVPYFSILPLVVPTLPRLVTRVSTASFSSNVSPADWKSIRHFLKAPSRLTPSLPS